MHLATAESSMAAVVDAGERNSRIVRLMRCTVVSLVSRNFGGAAPGRTKEKVELPIWRAAGSTPAKPPRPSGLHVQPPAKISWESSTTPGSEASRKSFACDFPALDDSLRFSTPTLVFEN